MKISARWPLVALLLAVAGCAGVGPLAQKSTEQVVSERADARWHYLIKGDFKAAYDYLSPSYRSAVSPEQYRAGLKEGLWTGVEVRTVQCPKEDVCKVEVDVDYAYILKGRSVPGKRSLQETWRKDMGQWWNVPE